MRNLFSCCLVLACASVSVADDIVVEQEASGEKAAESPYKFTLQKDGFKYDGYRMWGKVTDAKDQPPSGKLSIVFTAYDHKNKFLGRASVELGEETRGGPLGHVDELVLETDGVKPAKITWKLVSPKDRFKDTKVVKSEDKTSGDTDAKFEVQKLGSGYSGLSVWGKVSNSTEDVFEGLNVIVTAYDADGKFLGRGTGSVRPSKIESGQVGYVDDLNINLEGKVPAKLEWKVIQERF